MEDTSVQFHLRTVMFKTTLAVALGLSFAAQTIAQDSINKFRYQPNTIVVGTVYHYLKTNLDSTHPEHISQYVAAKDRLEVFKFHPKEEPAALVEAQMDWRSFSARELKSWHVLANGETKLIATLTYLDDEKAVKVSVPALRPGSETVAIKYLPFHIYNFDLGSLNFAFRHLVEPRGSFVIGIADPTFQAQGPLFKYRGEVTVTYIGEEARQDRRCRKYRIDGPGLENRGGLIWVNKTVGHIEDMEIDLPDNPAWKNFKLRLTGIQQMSRKQWQDFMKSQF